MRHSTGRKESDTLDADSLDRPTEGCNSDQHHDLPAPCLPSESVRRASSSDHRSVRCPRGPRCDVCVCGGRRTVVLSALSRLRSSGAGPLTCRRHLCRESASSAVRDYTCVPYLVCNLKYASYPVVYQSLALAHRRDRHRPHLSRLTHHSMSHRPPRPVTRHHTKLHTPTLHDTHRLTPRSHISQLHIDTSQPHRDEPRALRHQLFGQVSSQTFHKSLGVWLRVRSPGLGPCLFARATVQVYVYYASYVFVRGGERVLPAVSPGW